MLSSASVQPLHGTRASRALTSSTWDFRSVVAHELGHALGFGSLFDSATDTFWNGGLTEWEKHLRDASTGGNQPNAGGTGTPGNFNQTANPVYFDGTNANAANGGSRVAIYAPSTFSSKFQPDPSQRNHLSKRLDESLHCQRSNGPPALGLGMADDERSRMGH